jgi:excisionase family DNA binding protein
VAAVCARCSHHFSGGLVSGDLLNLRDAAARLGCSPLSLYEWIRLGRMPAVRLGRAIRIRRTDVEGVIQNGLPELGTLEPAER